MDLVVGSTGLVGKAIALGLRRKGRPVRAIVRGGAGRNDAEGLLHANCEIADADLTKQDSLARACEGIESVVCTATSMPHGRDDGLRRVDHDGSLALIEAAESAGVRRFVYMSYTGNLREESPLETAKRECEDRLLTGKMHAIILRPSFFMEMWLSPLLGFDPANGKARIYGSGENGVSYISAFDVADFACAVVEHPPEGNAVLELGGPEPVSQLGAVQIFEDALRKQFTREFVPVEAIQRQHASSDPLEKTFAALTLGYIKGDEIAGARETAQRFGVKLRSVEDYVRTLRQASTAHAQN
jgi:NADH dehydrogenase